MPSRSSYYLANGKKAYGHAWNKERTAYLQDNPYCCKCALEGIRVLATVVDHRVDHKGDVDLFWDKGNWQPMCMPHHNEKTGRTHSRGKPRAKMSGCDINGQPHSPKHLWNDGGIYLPKLPKPSCPVTVVCGPPASGKSSFVEFHRDPKDKVIDLDLIVSELSGRPIYHRGSTKLDDAIALRNRRLAALARKGNRHAWLIVSAPLARERDHWRTQLHADRVVMLEPGMVECKRRVREDARRQHDIPIHMNGINDWYQRYQIDHRDDVVDWVMA